MKKICDICGEEFELSKNQEKKFNKDNSIKLFCSAKCAGKYGATNRKPVSGSVRSMVVKHTCDVCGKEFELSYEQRKKYIKDNSSKFYCSLSCRNKAIVTKERPIIKCAYCGKEFNMSNDQFTKYNKDNTVKLYCSRSCIANATFKNADFSARTAKLQELYNDKEWVARRTNKTKQTNLQRYGVENVFQLQEVKLKSNNTKKERYNDEHFNNREKFFKTCERENIDIYATRSNEVKSKISMTWQNKSEEEKQSIKDKLSISNKQAWEQMSNERKEIMKIKQDKARLKNIDTLSVIAIRIIRDKEMFKQYILSIPENIRCRHRISEELNISYSYVSELLNKYNLTDKELSFKTNISYPQLKLFEFIQDNYAGTILYNNRSIITPLELDIYIPEKNLAIEYNGNYYHTEEKVGKLAHYNKSKLCEEKGIRLIHIFEYEWENERQRPILENIIKSALGITETLYARKLVIEERPSASMKDFFETNNIQGFRGGKTAICLVDKDTNEVYMSYIMGNAFFGKDKYQWEVIRGATKLGYTVVGGASRIWKYFIETYNPDNCVYYVDYNYFNGKSLENLPQMEFVTTQYSFKNYWVELDVVKNREPQRHQEIKGLEQQGLVIPIYNAGTKVYVWTKQ